MDKTPEKSESKTNSLVDDLQKETEALRMGILKPQEAESPHTRDNPLTVRAVPELPALELESGHRRPNPWAASKSVQNENPFAKKSPSTDKTDTGNNGGPDAFKLPELPIVADKAAEAKKVVPVVFEQKKTTPDFLPEMPMPGVDAKVAPTAEVELKTIDGKTAKLDDGTYKRDDQGRIVEMISADGQTKRNFKYDDPAFPNRITAETINDKETYKFIGNNKIGGKPYKIDDYEVNSYSIYDEKNQLKGNWSGVRALSPDGVYAYKNDKQEKIEFQGANGQKLSDAEKADRDKNGIWPNQISLTREDGSKIEARLNGNKLQTFSETVKENGQDKEIVWSKAENKWTSNESPARERKNMAVLRDGTVTYETQDGIKHEQYKNSTRSELDLDGSRRDYNKADQLVSVSLSNGDLRQLKYDGNELVSIQDKNGKSGKETVWTKQAGTDEWSDGQKTESRKELKIAADGAIKFKNSDGLNISDNPNQSRLSFDNNNRPLKIDFNSGSSRSFEYKNDKLVAVTDHVKFADRETSSTFNRVGDTDDWETKEASGRIRTRRNIEAKENGDYSYIAADKKEHNSRAYDLERQAKGDIVVGSDSIQEARDRFVDTAKERGINMPRSEKYLNQLDQISRRYNTSPEQMAKALDNLSDILSAEQSPLYSRDELNNIVETALHNLANPPEIDQGYHPTWNVTPTEVFAAAKFPDKYTALLREVSLTGQFTAANGQKATPPKNALKPGRDEKAYDLDKPNSDKRNLASQIYQMTTINAVYELGKHSSEKDGKDNGVRYVMGDVRKEKQADGSVVDLGEDMLINKNGTEVIGKNGKAVHGPEFLQDDNVTASELIVGSKMPYIGAPYKIDGETQWHFDLPTKERLQKCKQDGEFPLGISTLHGNHVQTIHDVTTDAKGQTWVLLDNQHGLKNDGWVTLEELHRTQQTHNELEPSKKAEDRPDRKN
ncbi:MAG: hypothetical protein K2X27_22810 [Candidatus Obscuribacterales bacterium]|nr:hypothetical protein [Candidatus Obscuribacterales bacterium]